MSFGGGSKSSSTTNNNIKDTTITETDNRVGGDNAVFGGNVSINPSDSPVGAINVTTTDLGAIKGGVDIALESIAGIQNANKSTIDAIKSTTSDTIGQAFGLANEARQSETSAAIQNLLKYGAGIVALGLLVWAYRSSRK